VHTGIRVISGVEIDAGFPAGRRDDRLPFKLWHLLIYGADPEHPSLWRCVVSLMSATWQMQTCCGDT